MVKKVLAVILGILSFFLMFAVGEPFGITAALVAVGIYHFTCQLVLSWGNSRALYDDWTLLLLLNAAMIVTAVLVLILEPDTKWKAVVVIVSLGSSMLGLAIAAALAKSARLSQ